MNVEQNYTLNDATARSSLNKIKLFIAVRCKFYTTLHNDGEHGASNMYSNKTTLTATCDVTADFSHILHPCWQGWLLLIYFLNIVRGPYESGK